MRVVLTTNLPFIATAFQTSLATDAQGACEEAAVSEYDYAGSKERLTNAYNDGGFGKLSEVIRLEMRAESRYLLSKQTREPEMSEGANA